MKTSAPTFCIRVMASLAEHLKKAKAAADAASVDLPNPDGGSANFDCVAIEIPCRLIESVREAVEDAVRRAGLTGSWGSLYGSAKYGGTHAFLLSCLSGFAAENTVAAEAFRESLRSSGWGCVVKYQTD